MNIGRPGNEKFHVPLFENPDSFYWPGYLWAWNDRLINDEISLQLNEFDSIGSRTISVLPVPKSFRPDSYPTNLEPEYLSDEYLKTYKEYVEEAHKLNMRVWIYDEGGWPSGSVCGEIVKKNPSFVENKLCCLEVVLKPGDPVEAPADCIAAFLFDGSDIVRQLKPSEKINVNILENYKLEIYYCTKNRSDSRYPDLLNPEVTLEFIKQTHEAYKSVVGSYFGNTIPMVFTDEPRVSNPPWTDGIETGFEKRFGYSLIENLPYIFRGEETGGQRVRVDYFDLWSERFAKAYLGQIRDWCHRNSLLSTGHLGGEDITIGSGIWGFGHVLRALRMFDVPGVDTIWRQVFPGDEQEVEVDMEYNNNPQHIKLNINQNHHFPKYASSVSHQEGLRWAFAEAFGVYGAGLTPEQMKWVADFLYVRGINLMIIVGSYLSTREYFMAGERPVFTKDSPLWEYLGLFHGYAARLGYSLCLGHPAIDTAVYLPVRDIWAGGPDLNNISESNDKLAKLLLENQCDFDFIDDDVLERESTGIIDGGLKIGPMQYRIVCISKTKWISEKSKKRLSEFISCGGRVLYIGDVEGPDMCEGIISIGFDEIGENVEPLVAITPANKKIRVCKRKLENGNMYFLVNEGLTRFECTAGFNESMTAVRLDPETGVCRRIDRKFLKNGMWSIPMEFSIAGSYLIYFTDDEISQVTETTEEKNVLIPLDDGWNCRIAKSNKIGEHEFEIVGNSGEALFPIKLGDWKGALGKGFSGTAEYSVQFKCSSDKAKKAHILDLGNVKYCCEVCINGENLGKRAWHPYIFHIYGKLKEGLNELKVMVTNTMANQYITSKSLNKWPDDLLTGYHRIALAFEKDSMPSGLYGPVNILAGGVEYKKQGDINDEN